MSLFSVVFQLVLTLASWAGFLLRGLRRFALDSKSRADCGRGFGHRDADSANSRALFFAVLLGYDDGDFPEISRAPYPLSLLLGVVGVWLLSGISGAQIVRVASQNRWSWWQSAFLVAVLMGVGQGVWPLLGFQFSIFGNWTIATHRMGIPVYNGVWSLISSVLWWIFPLGAPLGELAFRRIRAIQRDPFAQS